VDIRGQFFGRPFADFSSPGRVNTIQRVTLWLGCSLHGCELSHQNPTRTSRNSSCGSVLAQPILVPIPNGTGDGHSGAVVSVQVTADIPVGEVSSVDRERSDSADRPAALRRCLGERGLSPKVIELSEPFGPIHTLHTSPLGCHGVAGVLSGLSIPCRLMSTTSCLSLRLF
jgi:hypothetical protein